MNLTRQDNPVIESEKIILRRLNDCDLSEIMHLFDRPLTNERAAQLIQSAKAAWNEGSEYIFVVIAKEDMKLKGLIELYEEHENTVMTGYRIMPEHRHKGYASQAVHALVHELMKEDICTIYAAVQEDNEYSARLLRHNGFEETERKDGKMLFAFHKNADVPDDENVPEGCKVIYCAAGCFWGSEKAFRLLDGVVRTKTGYANGHTENPRYEDVCRGDTGFRETVQIVYDPAILSLQTIMKAYFLCVDPTLLNRQGNDIGTQYQSGVYYVNEEDGKTLQQIFIEERKKYKPFAVELKPLENFYPAEAYHQNYLEKNPGGYCHIKKIQFDAVKALNKTK
ncbi:MAG: peptide-methionine (S)-S-oxide reductase MsrA [Solobacterium sp.]|nr:peptide-methionine (S)-S-oxide reductase MsrA [Solobacterium sp.]